MKPTISSLFHRFRTKKPGGPPGVEALAGSFWGSEREAELEELQGLLGLRFRRLDLLQRALTHRSFLHDTGRGAAPRAEEDYEALEFFGDAVLNFVVSEFLLLTYPSLSEGRLSKLKAELVSTGQLSRLSQEFGLGRYLRLSHGEEKTGGREKRAILADIFESVTAAIYLDQGLETTRRFLRERFQPLLDQISAEKLEVTDFKSTLQERLHGLGQSEPSYRVVGETGPDHDKEFTVEVRSRGKTLAGGRGSSKKQAEQEAACRALARLDDNA